jgi:L-ascorbate metabolism protein UlaG (beta-lactamase superfamily)
MAEGPVIAARVDTAADRIVFLGHATVVIECDGVRLLTDPLLRARVLHLRRQVGAVPAALTAGIDAVLISHLHHDHFDPPSLRRLGRDVPMIVPEGAAAWVRRRRFAAVRELAAGDSVSVGALAVAAVHARHDGWRPGGPRAAAAGFVVRGGRSVYFAGDTELFEEMATLAPGLDVALLPVSGWGPRLGPGHMDPLDAARAAALLRPRIAIPIHWGTLLAMGMSRRHRERLADPPQAFAAHVGRLAPSVEVRILSPGQETAM